MSSMLKKKSAFKPKAAIRRPAAPASSSQGIEGSEPVERLSKTPAPTPTPSVPEDASLSSQSQQPVPEASSTNAPPPPIVSAPPEPTPSSEETPRQRRPVVEVPQLPPTPRSTQVDETSTAHNSAHAGGATGGVARDCSEKTAEPSRSNDGQIGHASTSLPSTTVPPTVTPASTAAEPSTQPTLSGSLNQPIRDEASSLQTRAPDIVATTTTATATATTGSSCTPSTFAPTQSGGSLIPSIEIQDGAQSASALPNLRPVRGQAATPDDRTSAQVRSTIEAAGEQENAETPAGSKPKRPRKRKSDATGDQDGSAPKKRVRKKKADAGPGEGQEGGDAQAAPKTKQPRKKKPASTEDGNVTADGQDGTQNATSKKSTNHRSVTPEDAENEKIDPTQLKMADLTKDMHIGKKFSLHDELVERARAKRKAYYEKRKLKKNGGTPLEGEGSTAATPAPDAGGAGTPAPDDEGQAKGSADMTGQPSAQPQFQIIDGQIVLDTRSLQVDRHARAAEAAGVLEEEEENEFSRHVTSATYLKRSLKPNQWTLEETELFYKALASFGTDFDTISRMFPGKQRRHVKLKFNREERERPNRINAALIGEKTTAMMDIDEYKALTGMEYETTEAIYEEQRKAEKEFEDRQKQQEEEVLEEARKKREALFGGGLGDGDAVGGGGGVAGASAGGPAKPTKKKRMSKKKMALAQAEAMAGAEIVEDL